MNSQIKYQNVWVDGDSPEYTGVMWDTLLEATEAAQRDLELDGKFNGTLKLVRQEKVTTPLFGEPVIEVI